MLKFTQRQLARVRKKQHFSQSLPRGEHWTVLRLALAHTVTEICTTSFVNFVILIVCWRCKINAKSTCACAKETTFLTISTSWWTLNCSPLSSSSHGYWDLHHLICQFCQSDSYWLYAKINAKSTCACAKETTFFTISTSWWTLNCSPFSSSSYGYWDMHHFICQFCHNDCMLKVLKFMQSQLACVRKKQHFSQYLPFGELWTVLRLALAHTVTAICITSFVNFVILIVCWRC